MSMLRADELVAVIVTVSFAAGLNVYATVATLGLLARADLVVLPEPLALLSDWWVIGLSGALFIVEFFADKIPFFDLVWNAAQTVVRVPAGALLAWSATTSLSPGGQFVAALAGGLIALAAHGGKLVVRSAVTAEPVSVSVFSLAEDALAIGLTWFATQYPYLAAGIVLVLLVAVAFAIRWVVRALRRTFGRPPTTARASRGPASVAP
jgi:hypothetical protein